VGSRVFKLNDRVRIGGRTMLSPSVSLVGLTGRVVSSRADAPPGTVAVWVDWEEGGYTDTDELPSVVNVPGQHLEMVEVNTPTLTLEPPLAKQASPTSLQPDETTPTGEAETSEEDTKPTKGNFLRLVD